MYAYVRTPPPRRLPGQIPASGLGLRFTLPSFIPVVGGSSIDVGGKSASSDPCNGTDASKFTCANACADAGTAAKLQAAFAAVPGLQAKVAAVWSGVRFATRPPQGAREVACFASWILSTDWAGKGEQIGAILSSATGQTATVGGGAGSKPLGPSGTPAQQQNVGGGFNLLTMALLGVGGILAYKAFAK